MSVEVNQTEVQEQAKQTDKEMNFAKVRQQLEQERQARLQAEERAAQLEKAQKQAQKPIDDDEDDDADPYVDNKRLKRKLNDFGRDLDEKIERKAEEKARAMIEAEKKESWLRTNSDFYDIMQHANAFAAKDPELAETILNMPDTFERQKLVYKSIKALGLHKKDEPKPTIQDKIDQNRRSPYYQPSGVAAAPYAGGGDFSATGQKNAFAKMQELKKRLGG